MSVPNPIDYFCGAWSWLSNFWPCVVTYKDEPYTSVEHAYQAAKAFYYHDRSMIRNALRAGDAKRMGKRIMLRHDFQLTKDDTMSALLLQKFDAELNPSLRAKLMATKPRELIEGNHWHDNYWGRCRCPYCDDKEKLNKLGKMLMLIRDAT